MSLQCAACGKQNIARRYPVLKTAPAGEQQEIGVCANCRPNFALVETVFTRVSGPPYTQAERPPFWSNGGVVRWREGEEFNPAPIPLSEYPLIEDFEVMLEGVIKKHRLGKEAPFYFVWLFSPSRGYLTYILGADELEDLCCTDFTPPQADFQRPWHDVDQGWHIVLAADDEFVYILAGGGPESGSLETYTTWFKVEKRHYARQWEQAVQLARSLAATRQDKPKS